MKLLDALNTVLPFMNAPAATSLSSKHPTIGALISAFDSAREAVLDRSLWFNTRTVNLYPDGAGVIFSPTSCRAIYPTTGTDILEFRDGVLWNLTQNTNTWSGPVEVQIVDELTFENLPNVAARYVMYQGATDMYVAKFGTDGTAQLLAQHAQEADRMVQREHLRKRKFSMTNTPALQKLLRALSGN